MRPYSEGKTPGLAYGLIGEVFMDRRDKGDPFEAALERRKSPKASVSDKKDNCIIPFPPKQGSYLGLRELQR